MSRRDFILGGVFLLGVVLSACGAGEVSPETLVQERCARCHSLAPIEGARKSEQEWSLTVYRMIDKGARLNDQEAEVVIDYLSEMYGPETP